MATGALDANGIWQYGEDDSEATFSGLLNKLGGSTSTTVTRLEEMSGLTDAQKATHRDNIGIGLVNVVPTSVAVSGGSATANTLGVVTFTNATSLSLNGVFTSAYEKYAIYTTINAATVGTQLRFRLRAAGVDQTGNYLWGGNQTTNAGATSTFYGVQTSVVIGEFSNQSVTTHSSVMDIFNPFLSQRKGFTHRFMYDNLTYVFGGYFGGSYQLTTSCDGFTIYPGAAGNFTGKVQVFGYNE